jgi:hypothetical protein
VKGTDLNGDLHTKIEKYTILLVVFTGVFHTDIWVSLLPAVTLSRLLEISAEFSTASLV